MFRIPNSWLVVTLSFLALPLAARAADTAPASLDAASAFERLKALAGDWLDVDGSLGMKDQVTVSYRVTGGGQVVVETQFAGTPHEMMTIYHRDGADLVAVHYCAAGNQPRFRAKSFSADGVDFAFDGGTNLDPSKDTHIHAARFHFDSADEIRSDWIGWMKGAEVAGGTQTFHLKRKQ